MRDSKIKGAEATIQDIENTEDVRVPNAKVFDKHFEFVYCAIFHSRQGTSISGNFAKQMEPNRIKYGR